MIISFSDSSPTIPWGYYTIGGGCLYSGFASLSPVTMTIFQNAACHSTQVVEKFIGLWYAWYKPTNKVQFGDEKVFQAKKYKIGFDIWGLLLFIVIMLPNFVWFVVPAPNDVLRNGSITPVVDMFAQMCQVLMVVALCIVINTQREQPMSMKHKVAIFLFVELYFIGWICYYAGLINAIIILVLCVAPCMVFILFSSARRNIVSLFFACAFMVCHLVYGIVNFII